MKVLVISENNKLLDAVASFASLKEKDISMQTSRSTLLNATQRIANEMPDVVVLEMDGALGNQVFELVERFKTQYRNMVFMMMSKDTSTELLLRAMRSGISEIIALPLTEQSMLKVLDRQQTKFTTKASHASKVLSFISCKGGSGNTFIATNIAYIIANGFNKKTLLIDANTYFGDASMYITNINPSMTLADVCKQMERFDYAFLASSLLTVSPNLSVLAAAENPADSSEILPEHLEKIIRVARNYYDYIILDLGRQVDALTVKALDLSDTVYPVLQLVLPYVRDAKHMLDLFKSLGYSSEKIKPIVNRYIKSSKLKLTDISGIVNPQTVITLPNDYDAVTDSVNQGVSVYHAYRSKPITKSLIHLSESITEKQLEEKTLFTKLFK